MPELPEVETVRAGLEPAVVGRRIGQVLVLHPRPVRRHAAGPDAFAATLAGRTFGIPRRRGKYLWIPFVDGDALLAHLGMSGQFRLNDPSAPLQRHARVLLDLHPETGPPLQMDASRVEGASPTGSFRVEGASPTGSFRIDGAGSPTGPSLLEAGSPTQPGVQQLRFVDQRMFGGLSVSVGGAQLPPEIAHVARDVFDPEFDLDRVVALVARRSSAVKRVLLDQTVVSGIGNIYADEALWRTRLNGEAPADTLTPSTIRALLLAARDVMTAALAQGGTSFDALYVNVNGESGYFDRTLEAYGREGQPCRRCGTPIIRESFMNRSSFRCPRCQAFPT